MSDPRTIAIVGAGPKGFGCLERLVIEMNRCADPPRLHVSLHDPAPHPGAGPIYDPEQPPYLLMNFAARHVDLWSRGDTALEQERWPDLLAWLAEHHPAWADGDAFVPRRLVGAYLQATCAALLGALPPHLTVDRVAGVVTDLQRCGSGWWVSHDDSTFDRYADEIMITVGHGTWTLGRAPLAPADERCGRGEHPTTIAPPFPVAARLGPDRIPPSTTVAMRGFALSFIDATLALTVGRGGRFEGIAAGDLAAARYHASGAEVERILPFSRTGLPLLAKPGPELMGLAGELPDVWDRLRRRLRATSGAPLLPGLRDALGEAAEGVLRHARGALPDVQSRAIRGQLRADRAVAEESGAGRGTAATGPRSGPVPGVGARSLAAMRRSVEVATGRRRPDAAWAVGEAWRQGYPALVERVGHGGVAVGERSDLDSLAVRMERLAFGAPAENLHRVVVLVDAGLVDLAHLRAPRVITHDDGFILVTGGRRTPIDVLVDAVIEPPGVAPGASLWGQLLRRGQARVAPGTRGVEITADAMCVDREGRPVPGLAAVGRATEGWVLGNDTLSRTLHAETRRWAHRIVADAREVTMTSALVAGAQPARPKGSR